MGGGWLFARPMWPGGNNPLKAGGVDSELEIAGRLGVCLCRAEKHFDFIIFILLTPWESPMRAPSRREVGRESSLTC